LKTFLTFKNLIFIRRRLIEMHYTNGFLALVALIFAIWTTSYSNIVIIVATALILIHEISHISGMCSCGPKMSKKTTKSKK